MKVHRSIFEYDNYRQFLKDVYADAKTENKNFSFRYFSRIAGFRAGNILKLVMDGERNIAPYSISKFTKALGLNKEESFFFYHLVLMNQAKTAEEKRRHAESLMGCRRYRQLHPLHPSQFNYFSRWYFVPLRELVSLPGFREDPEWIAKKISPAISPAEAKRALEELLKLGMLRRGPAGKLELADYNVSSGDEVTSAAMAQYHREMLQRASESIDRHPREKRDISSVTLGLSRETAVFIKEKIQKFRKELMAAALKDQNPEVIYQLNFQFFPLSRDDEKGKI